MAQPPPYNRQTSFANLQALNPSGQPPGNTMDAEYNAIKTTLDATLVNLKLIQNDDGTVLNQSIGPAQLSSQLSLGFTAPTVWTAATAYTASPASTVFQGSSLYICLKSHTSGIFANDLAAGDWLKIIDLAAVPLVNANQIAVASHGSNILTNVQTSLNNLEDNKAATSHTHTATQISDSTSLGRSLLVAPNVAAVTTALGLGTLAFLSSVPAVTAIPGQLAYTGRTFATLGATSDNLTPTAWATSSVVWLSSSGAFTISGFGATIDGDTKYIHNISGFTMTLLANSASSLAANRITLERPITIGPAQGVVIQYDGLSAVWRLPAPLPASGMGGGIRNLRIGNVANVLGDSAPGAPNSQAYIKADNISLDEGTGVAWNTGAFAVTIDATVVGAGGIDTGSLGASTWYSVWVIGNSTTNAFNGLISTSTASPTLPSGYNFKARVGWMRTDGSSHFLKMLQMGRKGRYSGTFPTITSGNNAGADVSVTAFVPPTAVSISLFPFGSLPSGTVITASPTGTASPGAPLESANATGSTQAANSGVSEFLLEAATVRYTSTAGAGPGIACYGWEDIS